MCLAPCKMSCSDERYAQEATAVRHFLATQGESLIAKLEAERDTASAALEFEEAAAIHGRLKRVETVRGQANEAVRQLDQLKALILQAAADPESVALFLLDQGLLAGPVLFSTAGMRHANEQSGSSSLFAQPVAVEALPLVEGGEAGEKPILLSRDALQERLVKSLAELESLAHRKAGAEALAAQLCLFTRWYYRPEKKRVGEVFFQEAESGWPYKAILRGISRVFMTGRKGPELQTVTLNTQGDAQ